MSSVLNRDPGTSPVEPVHVDGEPERVRRIRAGAAERFNILGWPTTRLEAWKYTSLASLTAIDWKSDLRHVDAETLAPPFGDKPVAELVFVNGVLHANHATLANEHPGIRITPMREAMQSERFDQHFSRYADYENHALTALNTALWQDGAFIEITPDTAFEGFIHLFYIGSGSVKHPVASHVRNLIGPRKSGDGGRKLRRAGYVLHEYGHGNCRRRECDRRSLQTRVRVVGCVSSRNCADSPGALVAGNLADDRGRRRSRPE